MATTTASLVPPHNTEAEMSALGSMLLAERAALEVSELLREDDFYVPAHREIFRAIGRLMLERRAVDLLTVKAELERAGDLNTVGGADYLIQLAERVPSPANAEHYAHIVLEKATLRRLGDAGSQIVKLSMDEEGSVEDKVEAAEKMVFDVGQDRLGAEFESVSALAKAFFEDVDQLYEHRKPLLGLASGFVDLDHMTGGMYEGELTILAARPSMGKTSLALNIALHAARAGKGNVAVFSLEMNGKQLVRRLLSMLSGVEMGALQRPTLSDDDYRAMVDACEQLYELPLYIDESSDLSPMTMLAKCRRLAAHGGISLIAVDYLQLMRSPRRVENRVQEISEVARMLKAVSKDLRVPVVALSQLNRAVEGRTNKRPQLSDLRESGSIEAEADVVMFIYRDAYYRRRDSPEDVEFEPESIEEAEIIISKHRNGPTGTVRLAFEPAMTRFRNLRQ